MIAQNPFYRGQPPFPLPKPDAIEGRGGLDPDRFLVDPLSPRATQFASASSVDDERLFRNFKPRWWMRTA